MTIIEFYEKIGGDYKGVLARLGTEKLVSHIALMFLKDDSYPKLVDAFEKRDAEEAFLAAHTLKSVCINLGFDKLYKYAFDLTESLRPRTFAANSDGLYQDVVIEYGKVASLLAQVKE